MIVNQAFARRFFRGQNPVGRKVRASGKWCRVVGMTRDSKYFSPAEPPTPHFYLPILQFYNSSPELYFLVRTAGQPLQSIPLLRRAVIETDPNAVAFHAISLEEYTEVATFGQKVAANLMAALGLMCLLLAGMGLYSVMSYTVSQRIPEIGIRMAMGARPRNVIGMMLRQGMSLALAGMAIGALGALATTRLVSSMLIHVEAADPTTFVIAALFLGTVALMATWLPSFRATRIDPVSAMRR
jgi:predicted lysophospholipase L1 biosynthesis ABC-type transport system permease subunit